MHHGGLHTGLRKQVDDHILDPARRSVLVNQQTLAPDDGASLLHGSSKSADRFLKMIRVDKIVPAAPNELLRSISQHALDGGTDVKYCPFGVSQEHDIIGV